MSDEEKICGCGVFSTTKKKPKIINIHQYYKDYLKMGFSCIGLMDDPHA
jgi:hypothetical protein